MLTLKQIENVEQAFLHLKRSMEILNRAEHMHEKVMMFHNTDDMYLTTTAQKSRDMVVQAWNVTMEAQDDLGWALETLLNNATAIVEGADGHRDDSLVEWK